MNFVRSCGSLDVPCLLAVNCGKTPVIFWLGFPMETNNCDQPRNLNVWPCADLHGVVSTMFCGSVKSGGPATAVVGLKH